MSSRIKPSTYKYINVCPAVLNHLRILFISLWIVLTTPITTCRSYRRKFLIIVSLLMPNATFNIFKSYFVALSLLGEETLPHLSDILTLSCTIYIYIV